MEIEKKKVSVTGSILKKLSASANKLKNAVAIKLTPVLTNATGSEVTLVSTKTFAEQVTKGNTIYVVRHDFNLHGETVTLPKDCVLDFRGGTLSDGILVGRDSIIRAEGRIFFNVMVDGTWDCIGNVGWFADGTPIVHDQWGCRFDNLLDQSADIQKALDSSFREIHFPPKCFYVSHTLVLTKEKRLVLHGSDMKLSLLQSSVGKKNTTVIFSNQDICLLRIAVNESYQNAVSIEGGSFDLSLCKNYTKNCIEVRADEEGQRLWGLTITTNIKGTFGQMTGCGLNINPVANYSLTGNTAYVSQVRINSNISNFGLGVKVTDYSAAHSWCSDVVVDGAIINCPVCVDANCDCDIRAMLQSGKFFDQKENGTPLIRYGGLNCSVSSNVFDIRMSSGTNWSNEFALEVTNKSATVTADGHFRSFCVACKKLGWPVVKGNVEL